MHEFPWFWVMFGMFFWLFLFRPGRLRLCQGRSTNGEGRLPGDGPPRQRGRTELERALAERDALITKLEERVRVLDRIATDSSARLRDEIESLRDRPSAPRS